VFVLADILIQAIRRPEGLVARPADVQRGPGGFCWRVRRRSPAFQGLVSLLVEVSMEALVVAWFVAATTEGPPGAWVDAVLPGWLLVQAMALGLVVTWEGRGRAVVRAVELRPEALVVGRRVFGLDELAGIGVATSGVGPWRTAEITVTPVVGEPLRFAADGDDDASLRDLVERIDRARVGARRRAG